MTLPYNGRYFSFGHSPTITYCAQVRFRLACQPCKHYLLPVNGFNFSLPLEGGGNPSEQKARDAVDGRSFSWHKATKIHYARILLQSPTAPAPSRREPFIQHHSALTFYLHSIYRQSLY